jgi:membrane dipeptidase
MLQLDSGQETRARTLHQQSVVIDALNASIMDEDYWLKMQQGGVTATNFTIAMNHNLSETVKLMGALYGQLARSKVAMLVEQAADIRAAKAQGKVGIIVGFQNIGPFEGDMSLLPIFHRLGVRIIQLTYHFRNICGDGCVEPGNGGLSLWGKDLIQRMNALGMVVDLAHLSDRTAREAIAASKHPCIASHSNVYAKAPVYQNKQDDTIRALAERDGVMCIAAFPRMLEPGATLDTILDHIDYVVQLVGVNHVGIGLDFSEGWADSPIHRKKLLAIDGRIYDYPEDISSVTQVPNITRGLVARGYKDGDIQCILGSNLLRVFDQVMSR